jgi:molybdate transport system ATP-binding protein
MTAEPQWPDPRRIAAVVYDDGVAVDELLLAFARDLGEGGVRIGGVIQMPRETCGPRAPMCIRDVASGEVFPLCMTLPREDDCSFDPSKLRSAAVRIRAASDIGADLVFVSRFGRQEAAGGGFRQEMLHAASEGCTVLTAVRRGSVGNWLDMNEGTGTLLDARLWVLHHWWSDLRRTQPTSESAAGPLALAT